MLLLSEHALHHRENFVFSDVALEAKHLAERLGIELVATFLPVTVWALRCRRLVGRGPRLDSSEARGRSPCSSCNRDTGVCLPPLLVDLLVELLEGGLYRCHCLPGDQFLLLRVTLPELGDLVLLGLDRPAILAAELLHHHCLHQAVVVSQDSELSRGDIQFVDQLAALLRDLGIDQLVDVAQELLALSPVVDRLLLLHVEQVLVLVLSDMLSLDSAPQLGLTVLEQTLAENLQALVEVFHREHDTRATGQGLHFGAPVAELREERLDKAKLVHHVEVAVLVHRLVES